MLYLPWGKTSLKMQQGEWQGAVIIATWHLLISSVHFHSLWWFHSIRLSALRFAPFHQPPWEELKLSAVSAIAAFFHSFFTRSSFPLHLGEKNAGNKACSSRKQKKEFLIKGASLFFVICNLTASHGERLQEQQWDWAEEAGELLGRVLLTVLKSCAKLELYHREHFSMSP